MDVGVCEYVMQLITPVDDISFLYSAEIEVDHHSKITWLSSLQTNREEYRIRMWWLYSVKFSPLHAFALFHAITANKRRL